jgi:hypothetical protein
MKPFIDYWIVGETDHWSRICKKYWHSLTPKDWEESSKLYDTPRDGVPSSAKMLVCGEDSKKRTRNTGGKCNVS